MLREFIESSSGLAPIRQGLGLGSIISILSGVAILFGAKGAGASDCPPSGTGCKGKCEYFDDDWSRLEGYQTCGYYYVKEPKTHTTPDGTQITTYVCTKKWQSFCDPCGPPSPPCP